MSAPAHAIDISQKELGGQSYQDGLISRAMAHHGLRPETSPQGKVIERIVVVSNDVILDSDPWPQLLNVFHITTKPDVVERELLFKAGDSWSDDIVAESARNIRSYLFLSMGRVMPCRGSSADRVVALVVTKDLWSIRLNSNFVFVGSTLERLDLQFTEENVAGRMKRATVDYGFDLASQYLGQQYRDRRLVGSRLTVTEKADAIWNRDTGAFEGGVVDLTLQQPLYTLDTEWAWIASFNYRRDIYRLFSGGQIGLFSSAVTGQAIPFSFKRNRFDLNLGVTRSFGRAVKNNFTAGYRAFDRRYSLPDLTTPVLAATLTDFSSSVLPLSEKAGMVYFAYQGYRSDFHQLLDIDTYALTEDYRLGPELVAEVRWASRALGFDSAFLQAFSTLSWTQLNSDDLFTASVSGNIRYQPEISSVSNWVNGSVSAAIRNVSPKLAWFRLHTALQGTHRYNDLNRSFDTLGGDTSLRGYPSSYLRGANLWVGNVEARTLPLPLLSTFVGLASFFDIGGAADRVSALGAHPSVGVGARILFPQFNSAVLRVDFGLPLEKIKGDTPSYLTVQYGQAF